MAKAVFALIVSFALILGGTVALVTRWEDSRNAATSVATFNDGYATAMRDACQDHDAYACTWMSDNNGGK